MKIKCNIYKINTNKEFIEKLNSINLKTNENDMFIINCHGDYFFHNNEKHVGFIINNPDSCKSRTDSVFNSNEIAAYVKNLSVPIFSTGCFTGDYNLAQPLLNSGCPYYIGPMSAIESNAEMCCISTFFYHYFAKKLSLDKAFSKLKQIDDQCNKYVLHGKEEKDIAFNQNNGIVEKVYERNINC